MIHYFNVTALRMLQEKPRKQLQNVLTVVLLHKHSASLFSIHRMFFVYVRIKTHTSR